MATGLGKTWLAAFDAARPQFRRILFVAHHEEIPRQSLDIFRQVQPDADLGLYYGGEKQPDARIVFASVQTLTADLNRFDADTFDYVVIDEFHHAAARTYRKIIEYFHPTFLLGLTATPNRMDGADLLALCSDNLVFECPLSDAIESGDLCSFRYYGIADDVDYTPIPWRGGRFDLAALTAAYETEQRAQHALDIWRARAGSRTIAFCVTVAHAEYLASFFQQHGVESVAVHSGPSSAPRRGSVDRLRAGDLRVIFTVDVFNEGLDVPGIDTVMMLRPTELPVIFLQQLGRGLRKDANKRDLVVIDFIGNHRSFLIKPRTLLALGSGSEPSTARVLKALESEDFSLPAGCSVTYDPVLVDILRKVARVGARSALAEYCRSFTDERGRRPTAAQAYEAGYNPASARARHGHWFGLFRDLDLLSAEEAEVVDRHGDILAGFEKEPITKSYKLVTLSALLRLGKLRSGAGVAELAWTAHQIVSADPRLLADTRTLEMPDPAWATAEVWRDYWVRWPLAAWSGKLRGASSGWFRLDESRFTPTFGVDDRLGEAFDRMVEEILDYRYARHLLNRASSAMEAAILKVIQAHGRPILMLNREGNPNLPEGETPFRAADTAYVGNFVKIALNVAHRPGASENVLPDLLRSWFGPAAGQPGTSHQVQLVRRADGWEMAPLLGTDLGRASTA